MWNGEVMREGQALKQDTKRKYRVNEKQQS